MRGITNLMMLLTFIFVLLMTLFNGATKALLEESVNNTSSIDNQSPPSTGSKLFDSLLAKNMCAGKKVNAIKFNYRDSFLIYDKGHRLFRRKKESMMRCLQDAVKRNLTYSPYDFNKNFLEYEYPDTSACTEYQYVITAQSVQNGDYIKLKVGDIDNIEIYAIMPNGCMDMVFIENFLHENLARVTRLFEEKIPRFNQSINQVSVLESSGPEDHIVNFFQLFGSAVHKIYKDLVKQDDKFTIKGPGTLLYLLSRYMECHAKNFFPKYLRDALDEIEYINGFWFDFDVRKRTTDRNQNVTIFIDRKAAQFSYDVAFTDLYKVISVYVNDKYMDNKKLFGKILSEHYYMNRDPTCELQKNDQDPKLLQNENSNKTIESVLVNE